MARHLFTSESVTEGHPDKVCDKVADAVLDAVLEQDPNGRVACEATCVTDRLIIMGEITTRAKINIPEIARRVILSIGYDAPEKGFNGHSCDIMTFVHEQSPDIALGVDRSCELKAGRDELYNLNGAGDQGMMFGYACDETEELMPLPISLAHRLALRLAGVRKDGTLPYLYPDGKTQVTVEYDGAGRPAWVHTIVVSAQHAAGVPLERIRQDILNYVIRPIVPERLFDGSTLVYINPTGRFVTGGPAGDSGLTGRKIVVDTYGGIGRIGGGSFSGKDPTKVDRSAAYAARYAAKNIVAAGLAKKCELQLAYAIGVAHPVSVMTDTFGTGLVPDDVLSELVAETFDFRPAAIIDGLKLFRPIYGPLAAYGHFGRTDLDLPWEKTDRTEDLKKAAGI